MSGFEGLPVDPNRVFTEEYWSEAHDAEPFMPHSGPSHYQKTIAKQLLAELIPKIVSGEITGMVLERGRFNPTDKDLARTSPHNMPGTVLIADVESVRPLDSFDSREQKHPWRLEGKGNPIDQTAETRTLLRASRYLERNRTEYLSGRVIYSNSAHEYERHISIVALVLNRLGTATPQSPSFCVIPDPSSGRRPIISLASSIHGLTSDVQIGETYHTYHTADRNRYIGLRRLRSLEICMSGRAAEASAPSLAKALGRLGHSQV